MNTTLATTTATTRTRRSTTRRHPNAQPVELSTAGRALGKRPASEITRLVFFVILALSACVAVLGVLDQASDTSPDAPPPDVIIEVD